MNQCLEDLIAAWEIHNEINLFILRWIPPEGLEAVTLLKTANPRRGGTSPGSARGGHRGPVRRRSGPAPQGLEVSRPFCPTLPTRQPGGVRCARTHVYSRRGHQSPCRSPSKLRIETESVPNQRAS